MTRWIPGIAVAVAAVGCAEPVQPEPAYSGFAIHSVEIGRSPYDVVDHAGTGVMRSAFTSVYSNYSRYTEDALGPIDSRVLASPAGSHQQSLLWRLRLQADSELAAPTRAMFQPYDYEGTALAPTEFAEVESHGDALPIVLRGGRIEVPLGRMFDASMGDPGWYETDVSLAYAYRTAEGDVMTGVIGFTLDEDALQQIVIPALTRGLAQVWNPHPTSTAVQTIDRNGNGQIDEADVASWLQLLAPPNVDSDGDGVDDVYGFTFGFRATGGPSSAWP